MSKILANEIANYGDDSPIDLKEGLNIPAGKPLQAAGSSGSAGQVLSTTGTSVEWVAGFDGDYNSLSNRPTIPAAQVNSDWNASGGVAVILNKPVVPPLPTVTTASASGGGSLAYNAGNGEFTFAPADLSNASNWDTAYGWGDHSTAGYLTAEADTLASVRARNANTGGNIQFGDNQFAVFGASGDLTIGHTGAYSFVRETGVGNLALAGDTNIDILNSALNEYKARFITNGGVWLYYDNAIKLQTTPGGVSIGGDIALGTGNINTTGKLLYANNYANTGELPGASTYDGMFATAAGSAYYSASGNWTELLTSTALSSITLDSLSNVDLSVAPANGQVLKWNGTAWAAANDLTGGGGGGLALTDLSVQSQTASGGGSLTYNNGSGVFTYTPPDLSGYLTSLGTALVDADFTTNGLMKRTADGVYTSTTDNSSNWDTAFGWGNHATQGYLTALPNHGLNTHTGVTLTNESAGQLLQYNGTAWVNWTPSYISSYSETDTLATVTARGASTSDSCIFNGGMTVGGNLNSNLGHLYFNSSTTEQHIGWVQREGIIRQFNNRLRIMGGNPYEEMAVFNVDGSVELYHDGSKKIETTSTGATITGALTAGGLTYPTTNGNSGEALISNGSGGVNWGPVATTGLQSRTTALVTQSIANGAVANLSITTPKTYVLYSIETSHAAWVTLYSDTASRTADASRAETTDPTPGSGVLAEVITTGAATQLITPGTICFNSSAAGTTYAKIVNKSGSTANVSVTLTYLQLEA